MAKLGPKTKLTERVIEKVAEAREMGAPFTIAAIHAGVSPQILSTWLKNGRDIRALIESGESPTLDEKQQLELRLVLKVEQADAREAMTLLQVVDKAAVSDPAWAYRVLTQRYPNDFVPLSRRELTGSIELRTIDAISFEEVQPPPDDSISDEGQPDETAVPSGPSPSNGGH